MTTQTNGNGKDQTTKFNQPQQTFNTPLGGSKPQKSPISQPKLKDLKPLVDYLIRLGRKVVEVKRSEDGRVVGFKTQCFHPLHGEKDDHYDENPSLQITLKDGNLLAYCFSCGNTKKDEVFKYFSAAISSALQGSVNHQPAPPPFLEDFPTEATITVYEVRERDGSLVARHVRFDFPDGGKTFKWQSPDGSDGLKGKPVNDLPLYAIDRIQPNCDVVIVEGEKSCEALWSVGVQAVATYGSTSIPSIRRLRELVKIVGKGKVFLWGDNDNSGRNHMMKIKDILANELEFDNVWWVQWVDAPEKGDAADAVAQGVDITEILRSAKPIIPQLHTQTEISQLLEKVDADWLVEGLLARGEVAILSARPKTAKSLIALNIGGCVATGSDFLGFPTKVGKVLFLPFERMKLTLQRTSKLGLGDNPNLMFWDVFHSPMPRIDAIKDLERVIRFHKIDLVIVDTLGHFLKPKLDTAKGNINAYDLVYSLMDEVKVVAEKMGCSFIFVHHDRKSDSGGDELAVLGSTAITGSADVILQLKAEGSRVIRMSIRGNRIEDQTCYLTITDDGWVELTDEPAITDEERARRVILRELAEAGEVKTENLIRVIRDELGKKSQEAAKKLTVRTLRVLVDGGLVETTKRGVYSLTEEGKTEAETLRNIRKGTKGHHIENVPNVPSEGKGQKGQKGHVPNVPNPEGTKGTNSIYVPNVPSTEPTPKPSPEKVTNVTNPDPFRCPKCGRERTPLGLSGELVCFDCDPDPNPEPTTNPSTEPEPIPEPTPEPPEVGDTVCKAEKPTNTILLQTCPHCGSDDVTFLGTVWVCISCGETFNPNDDSPTPSTPTNSPASGDCGGSPTPSPETRDTLEENLREENNDFPLLDDWFLKPHLVGDKTPDLRPPQVVGTGNYSPFTQTLPDGNIELKFEDKEETVTHQDLEGWKDFDEIPSVDLPQEFKPIPPTLVLDIECEGIERDGDGKLDLDTGNLLAVGLMFVKDGQKKTKIFRVDDCGGERDLLEVVFREIEKFVEGNPKSILTGYNLLGFDLPYLIRKAKKLGVKSPFWVEFDENGDHQQRVVAATEGTLMGNPITFTPVVTNLPLRVIDTLHLVCRWDYTAKKLQHYDLKSVAESFGVSPVDRVILSSNEIPQTFKVDPTKFNAYLDGDLKECWGLFENLFPSYWVISQITGLPVESVCVKSTAWIWEKILEREYRKVYSDFIIPQPDEKRNYVGGLVLARKGLFHNCCKVDVASLYPTIMLVYRVHSRKDFNGVALRWLKTLTLERLKWKKLGKEGDRFADGIQQGMKTLINSLYGFYGTGGYSFNDMDAAERVTTLGRKILTKMVAAIEGVGGVVVEADTDGIIVSHPNPKEILEVTQNAIPNPFKLELDWDGMIVFVADEKNYLVMTPEGKIKETKGTKLRGRDKPKFKTEFVQTFLQLYATQGKEVAEGFAKQVRDEIASGRGWDWVAETRKVGRGQADKFLKAVGLKEGEKVTFAYRDRKHKQITTSPDQPYDVEFYLREFDELLKEISETIKGNGK